jgi:hypothetical protein
MRGGVGYLINVVTNSSDRLVGVRYWNAELLLVFDFLTKLYYLSKHKATYAEYFYGFERSAGGASAMKSAALLSLYPYVRTRLEEYYNHLKM